eukprot:COSAG02_NODE_22162_length_760_cov_1.533233_1_plen_73_part_00
MLRCCLCCTLRSLALPDIAPTQRAALSNTQLHRATTAANAQQAKAVRRAVITKQLVEHEEGCVTLSEAELES